MKNYIIIFSAVLFCASLVSAHQKNESKYHIDGFCGVTQDNRKDIAFNNMVTELRNLHGQLYGLPYDQNYIQSTIIPEVNAKRAVIAPNYPKRENYGDDSQEAHRQLRFWFETYPVEHANYVTYLREFIAAHTK